MRGSARFGSVRRIALLVAVLWSGGLAVIGLTAPMYAVQTNTVSGGVSRGTDTLVGENGLWSLVLLLVPLSATVLVGGVLLARRVPGAMAVAWLITAALGVGMVLAMGSIGILLLPVCLALVVACLADRGNSPLWCRSEHPFNRCRVNDAF